jgi:hypothetical protein
MMIPWPTTWLLRLMSWDVFFCIDWILVYSFVYCCDVFTNNIVVYLARVACDAFCIAILFVYVTIKLLIISIFIVSSMYIVYSHSICFRSVYIICDYVTLMQ